MFGKFMGNVYQIQAKNSQISDAHKFQDKKLLSTQPWPKVKKIKKKQDQKRKESNDLKGSKFRILNELLYSNTSSYSLNYFSQNPEDYRTYHQGYQHQSQKWQNKPIYEIINYIKLNASKYIKQHILDIGCGDGVLQQTLRSINFKRISSYDLVACKPFVIVADAAHLPLKKHEAGLAVFCLSLMGLNYIQFIIQARRVLKNTGEMIIAQVQSRSPNWSEFIKLIEEVGFQLINNGYSLIKSNTQHKYFRIMHFRCQNNKLFPKCEQLQDKAEQLLHKCVYKKR